MFTAIAFDLSARHDEVRFARNIAIVLIGCFGFKADTATIRPSIPVCILFQFWRGRCPDFACAAAGRILVLAHVQPGTGRTV